MRPPSFHWRDDFHIFLVEILSILYKSLPTVSLKLFTMQERMTLLSFCSYVQWVPDSDVVVAQVTRLLSLSSDFERLAR